MVAGRGRAADGELLLLPATEAVSQLRDLLPPICVDTPATFRRPGLRPGPALDLLELFAFFRPAHTAAHIRRGPPWRWITPPKKNRLAV